MMTYLLGFLTAGHNQFVAVPIAAQTNQIGPWARALARLRGCVAKHPDNPGALPYQRSAARSERAWIGLGLAAWKAAEPAWNGERPWRGRLGEADDRTVPGRWEGDLPIGKDCESAAGTLVKRTIRYVLLLDPPAGRNASLAGHGVRQAITTQPAPSPGSKAKKVAYQF